MKKHVILFGILGLILHFSMQAQILTKYTTGFESGSQQNYTLTGSNTYSTTLYSGGSRALLLQQTRTDDAVLLLDTIDLSQSAPSLQYATLEFMHICKVRAQSTMQLPPSTSVPFGCIVEVKRIDESAWTQLRGSQYDMATGGTEDFALNGYFSDYSYAAAWNGGVNTTPNNTMWKKERFNLGSLFSSAMPGNRKLQIRFRLPKAAQPQGAETRPIYYGWLLDNIVVKASPSSLVVPTIKMLEYPVQATVAPARHPYSRDVLIKADISTTVAQGMDADSIYIDYVLGSEPQARINMVREGTSDIWSARIPYCGYDTVVAFRLVAMDATSNHNKSTFPTDESAFSYYSCVRGKDVQTNVGNSTTTSNAHPFASSGDVRSEYVYDKATLRAAGYTYGAITNLQFQIAGGGGATLNNFTVKMQNVDSTHTTDGTNFSKIDMKTVYSGTYTLPSGSGTTATIEFLDTFYYSGNDILMQLCYDNQFDGSATTLQMMPTVANKSSLSMPFLASYGIAPCTYLSGSELQQRPVFKFKQNKNLPLMKDLGIESILSPSLSTQANTPTAIQVSLRNMGITTINGVTIYYTIDGGAPQSYTWSGSLAGQTSTPVIITTSAQFTPGYKRVVAWVGDSLRIGSDIYIDHEPFNDTIGTTFIACAGPMSGVRYVGGPTPDYNNLDEIFEALYRCGVNGPLTVKLASGVYERQITLPSIQGVSSTNIVTFEPMDTTAGSVVITTPVSSACALDLQNTSYVRFKNILFNSRANTNAPYIVKLGISSRGCIFDSCTFIDSTIAGMTSLLFTGGASDFTVDHCSFKGGVVALNMMGSASDNCASNNRVYRSYFEMAKESCIRATNQISVIIDSNVINNTSTNPSFVLMLQSCYGPSRVLNNKVFSSNGASCFGATDFSGSAAGYAIVANNMFVSTNSAANQTIYTPVNIMDAEKVKYVYNSSKISVSGASNISAATIGGSGASDIYVLNNIFASTTEGNYALNFIPSDDNFVIDYNLYYSPGSILNKFGSTQVATLTDWVDRLYTETGAYHDTNSIMSQPVFLNITSMDLRTLSLAVQNAGTPIADITTDMFGTLRDSVAPCIGAYESAPLFNNLSIDDVLSPYTSCTLGNAEKIELVLKNYGYSTIPANSATLYYTRNNTGLTSHVIDREILPMDTIHFTTPSTNDLSVAFFQSDRTYDFKIWTSLSTDDDRSNDTIHHIVESLYQLAAPTVQPIHLNYATATQLNVPSATGVVYWYENDSTENHFYRGTPLQTDTLYRDTTFYISQRAEVELLKITEVQYHKSNPGVTYPYPSFMSSSTNVAVELSNVGNYPINLYGDTLIMISTSASYNNKIVALPNVTVQPGASFVVQYARGTDYNSQTCYSNFALSAMSNATANNVGIIYKDNNTIKDAVVLNQLPNTWSTYSVPSTIWTGTNVLTPGSSGIRRININSNSSSGWVVCDANPHTMTLGSVESNLVNYRDNGCLGYRTPVQITIQNIPALNLAVTNVELSNEGCGLYDESISLQLSNLGIGTVNNPVVQYSVDGVLYPADTINQVLGPFSSINHTFSALADLRSYNLNRYYDVKVWVHQNSADVYRYNDTVQLRVQSFYTPEIPDVDTLWHTLYGTSDTLYANSALTDTLAWYDENGNLLHIGNTYITDLLYENTTLQVKGLGVVYEDVHVGNLATTSATSYPSPYHSGSSYRKEQYIIKASELAALGYESGIIQTLAFHLDSVRILSGQAVFENYTISMGTTEDSLFSANGAWHTVSQVYHRTFDTITNAQRGWRTHVLDSAFVWNGESNIVVQVCYSMVEKSGSISARYTTASANSVLYVNNNTIPQCDTLMNGTRSNKRPDINFGFVGYACEGLPKIINVNLIDVPQIDVAALDIISFTPTGNYSDIPSPITFTLTNYGTTPLRDSLVIGWSLDGVFQSNIPWNGTIAPLSVDTIVLTNHSFTPGTHCIKLFVSHPADIQQTNDTVEGCYLFCFPAGVQQIGAGTSYPTFNDAITSLLNAGICGPVVFEVAPGTYNEQVVIPSIAGVDENNTITFRSANNDSTSVIITANPTASANYVVKFNETHNILFERMTVYATVSGNANQTTPANALVVENSQDLQFTGNVFRVKSSIINSPNANPVVLSRSVTDVVFEHNVMDSGYVGILSKVEELSDNISNIEIEGNDIKNFIFRGISFRRVNNIDIVKNKIVSGSSANSKPLTGIYLTEHYGSFDVLQNVVNLVDNRNGLKQGIHIGATVGSAADPGRLYNNMVSIIGTASGTVKSAGIYIDSSSYINVYFNTTRVQAGSNAPNSRGAEIAVCSDIVVKNNLFSNFGKGYAYYVTTPTCVSVSDFNNYYSTGDQEIPKFVFWGEDVATKNDLIALTSKDYSSVDIEPFFRTSTDLHLSSGTTVGMAEYLTDVTVDIDDEVRVSIPRPTIGAHEYKRPVHDLSIIKISAPAMTDTLVESDSLLVVVTVINNGSSLESYGTWYASIVGTSDQSIQVALPAMNPQDIVIDSVYVPMQLGVLDTQIVLATVECPNDTTLINDTLTKPFFLYPAYNIEATEAVVQTGDGCRLYNAPVSIKVKNVGYKTIPTTLPISVGYQARFKSQPNSNVSPSTLPTVPLQEVAYLSQPLGVNSTAEIFLNTPVDIYPHGLTKDIKVDVEAWANVQYDVKRMNDTTPILTVNSYHTPVLPVTQDTIIPYATLVTLNASQSQNRPLRWHIDSLVAPFHEPTNYNQSRTFLMEHIIFSDTVFYLSSISSSGCTSYYEPLNITVLPPVTIDACPKFVEEPVNKVYMSRDTVKIRLINYGTQPISNIPVTYRKHRANNPTLEFQEVTDTCPEIIQPGEEFVFAFDSLVDFEIVSGLQEYKITAWTDLETERTRENDTIVTIRVPVVEATYCEPVVSAKSGLDITRVRIGQMESNIPPIGHTYMNFVNFENPTMPVLPLYKNMTDTIFISAQDNENYYSGIFGFARAYIDWNRDGLFNDTSEVVMVSDTLFSGTTVFDTFVVPSDAYYGHTRMRVILNAKMSDQASYNGALDTLAFPREGVCPSLSSGCVQDFLVDVRKPRANNPALVRVVNPVEGIFGRTDSVAAVQLLLANYGENGLGEVVINYTYSPDSTIHTFTWNGYLNSMESQMIQLPEHTFREGTTIFNAWISSIDDNDSTDNFLTKEYHRFHEIQLNYADDFESLETKLYAPSGRTMYDRNLWEIGTPAKSRITSVKSGTNAIVTDLDAAVNVTNAYGNRSILYSPIFNIGQIKPDTLSFWMVRNIPENAHLKVEYYNYQNRWRALGSASDNCTDSWFTTSTMFLENSEGYAYEKFWYPLTVISGNGDFAQYTQLRFIFTVPEDGGTADGCAIDDFMIKRAQRAIDVGIVDIPYPTEPKFGQTIAPKVVLKNYGYDTIRECVVAYHPYGSALPKRATWRGVLAPNDTVTYQFDQSNTFTIEKTFPDTFAICAYTINELDLYWDNDSTCKDFYLSPLDVDAGMIEIVHPAGEVIAGDSVYVTVKVRNYGSTPIETMAVTYSFNGREPVYDTIDFIDALGRPLETFEFYDFTFNKRIRTVMGAMEISAATMYNGDEYVYNDSLSSRIYGISAVADITPVEIITTTSFNEVYVGLKIANVGSLGVNDFQVSFFYDNDTNTLVTEVFHREGQPLPALDTVIYVFNRILDLTNRAAPYDVIKAYVNYMYDVDNSNDTVTTIVPSYTDMRADTVFVEENENPECRVRLKVTNVGTSVVGGNSDVNVRVTVNGKDLSGSRREIMLPEQSYEIDLTETVEKSMTRTYKGTGRVIAANDNISSNNGTEVVVAVDYFGIVNIEEETIVLEQNYPNPFSNRTTIDFSIPTSGYVKFFVVNTLGRLVYQSNEFYTEGRHSIDFSYASLTTGIYYYGIEINGKRLMKKMIFRK